MDQTTPPPPPPPPGGSAERPDDPQFVGADGPSYGLFVHQAAGMVAAQANCAIAAALDLLVAYAAQHESTVDQTALDVIEHRVRFDGRSLS